MAVSADYSIPVQVNGFSCRNCTDVAYAKKHIDPAHPKSGPYNVNAAGDPSRINEAVVFGGSLTGRQSSSATPSLSATGTFLDVSA